MKKKKKKIKNKPISFLTIKKSEKVQKMKIK